MMTKKRRTHVTKQCPTSSGSCSYFSNSLRKMLKKNQGWLLGWEEHYMSNYQVIKQMKWIHALKLNGWEMLLTCGGTHTGPACFRRWCAPCWWFPEESPRLRWSFPTDTSAKQRDQVNKQKNEIPSKRFYSTRAQALLQSTCDAGASALLGCEAATYVHALPQISHVGFLCLNQFCHDEPKTDKQPHVTNPQNRVFLSHNSYSNTVTITQNQRGKQQAGFRPEELKL